MKLGVVSCGGNAATVLVGGTGVDRHECLLRRIGPLRRIGLADLIGGDDWLLVEAHIGHVADLRAGRQSGDWAKPCS